MKKVVYAIVSVLMAVLIVSGCQLGADSDSNLVAASSDAGSNASILPKIIKDTGIIRYIDLEGGFYGIYGKSGKYLPVNLPKDFQKSGLQVEFTAELLENHASVQMWGTAVKLLTMTADLGRQTLIMDYGTVDLGYDSGRVWILKGQMDTYKPSNLTKPFMRKGLPVNFVGTIDNLVFIRPPKYPILDLIEITTSK